LIQLQFPRRSLQALACRRRGSCNSDTQIHPPISGGEHEYCRVDSVSVPFNGFPFRYGRLRRTIVLHAQPALTRLQIIETATRDVDHSRLDTQELILGVRAREYGAGVNSENSRLWWRPQMVQVPCQTPGCTRFAKLRKT